MHGIASHLCEFEVIATAVQAMSPAAAILICLATANLFLTFVQSGEDRTGPGLGLDICRRNVELNGGLLTVRDVPGSGCIFTIDLPQHTQS